MAGDKSPRASGEYPIDPLLRNLPRPIDGGAAPSMTTEIRLLDDDLGFERDDGPTSRLDLLTIHPPPSRAAQSSAALPFEAPQTLPREAVIAFAGYPPPPASLLEAPFHALAVVRRRRGLVEARNLARARASPDVALYDAAIDAADANAVRRGVAVAVALLVGLLTGALLLGEVFSVSGP